MKPEELVQSLQQAVGERLRSVILYGSAATGDYVPKRSDYNVLVVLDRLSLAELKAMSGPTRRWVRQGNPPPLCFTLERLRASADVFPIELLDIKHRHRLLYGEDVVEQIEVSKANLRHQLEYELKSRLIRLREQYLLSSGSPRQVIELMIQSLSSFQVLARATLRLLRQDVPFTKVDAIEALSEELKIPLDPFEKVYRLKRGEMKPKEVDAEALFDQYLHAVEQMADAVDRFLADSDTSTQS